MNPSTSCDSHAYDDIMKLSRPRSRKHPPMALARRAAQFSPFAALTGYDQAVLEMARLTQEPPNLAEDEQERLDLELQRIRQTPASRVSLTYFVPDSRKAGGHYITISTTIKRIISSRQELILTDNTRVPFSYIVELHEEAT